MQQDNNIENRLRNLENQQLPDLSHMDEHWNGMTPLLSQHFPVPPKKRAWKKVTRRTITYMGVVAVVITTTYYAAQQYGKKDTHKKAVSISAEKKSVASKQNARGMQTTSVNSVPVKDHNASRVVIVHEQSDTIFAGSSSMDVNGSSIVKEKPLDNFFVRLKQPSQQFEIDPIRDTILYGKEGTILKIRANTFVYPDNKWVKKPVQVTLTECYRYADMIAHCLYTSSGDKQLVTGGMINLKASDIDNKEIRIIGYRPVEVSMPVEKYDPDMQLFLSDNKPVISSGTYSQIISPAGGVTNWRPAGQLQGYVNNTSFTPSNKIKVLDVQQQVNDPDHNNEMTLQVKTSKDIPEEKIRELMGNKYYYDSKKTKLQQVDTLPNGTKGKNTNTMITQKGFMVMDSVVVNFDWAIKEQLISKRDSIGFTVMVQADSLRYVEWRRKDSISFMKQNEFDQRYKFNITGLGWINCDKFYRSNQPTIEFSINVDPGMQNGLGNYTLVFTNLKSLIKGRYDNGQVKFGKLPEGEPVQLVCIAEYDGKVQACVQSFSISSNTIASLRFEDITEASFRQKIEKFQP